MGMADDILIGNGSSWSMKEERMYKLKSNSPEFTVTDGPLAGMTYRRGKSYAAIQPADARWFDKIVPQETPAPAVGAQPFGPAESAKPSAGAQTGVQ
jgi:hypothetical protein